MALRPPNHERRVFTLVAVAYVVLVGAPVGLLWLWGAQLGDAKPLAWTLVGAAALLGAWLLQQAREKAVAPLRTAASLLEAIRQGDYAVRGRGDDSQDAFGELIRQVNDIGETLRNQRLGAVEATNLVRSLMQQIDVSVLTFDAAGVLRYANRSAEALLAKSSPELIGQDAETLGLAELLQHSGDEPLDFSFPGGTGRWAVRRSAFREAGLPFTLLVIADLSKALREEELLAWRRLVRVLTHEINNSLTPIISITGTLENVVQKRLSGHEEQPDLAEGMRVVRSRAEALSRFINAYSQLAKLPPPQRRAVRLPDLLQRVCALEQRLSVRLELPPDVAEAGPLWLQADPDQLEQALINLLRNAVDAAMQTGGGVTVLCGKTMAGRCQIRILDEGLGLANAANLFVPFFTTKQGGSGIGLVLSRQIVEAHGGTLQLMNRVDRQGCEAVLELPLE